MSNLHQTSVVRLGEPRIHPNADTLELFDIRDAFQCVVKKGKHIAGDLAVYVEPDSVVPQTEPFRFIWETYVGIDGTVPEKRRRITVRKFRKEWSEGLLLPVADFPELTSAVEGADVSELLGVTHYDPDKGKEVGGDNERAPRKANRWPRSIKGWIYFLLYKLFRINLNGNTHGFDNEDGVDMPVFDVEALRHYKNAFEAGEEVQVTEKIHGSNGRFVFREDHMYAGSRTQWKAVSAHCIWRSVLEAQPWIEEWCRANPGFGLYGEVTPTQGEKFKYGSDNPQFFAFDVRTPEGKWMDVGAEIPSRELIKQWVPVLYRGPYDFDKFANQFLDGQTTVIGAKGIREGFVIRPVQERHVRGLGRLILKVVSNTFLEKDSQ
jgi:hypothetical protein